MSYTPGYEVGVVDQQHPRTATASTSTTFLLGLADRGPIDEAVLLPTRNVVDTVYGDEVPYSDLHDRYEFLKREGSGPIYFVRVVGPAAAAATITLNDADPSPSVTFTASSPGAWANGATGGLKLAVLDSGGGAVQLALTLDDATVATSVVATVLDDLDGWTTPYGALTIVGDTLPAVAAAASLAGGDDDRGSITADEWIDAMSAIPAELGPGQIVPAGEGDVTVQAAALQHSSDRNRYALLDAPIGSVGTIESSAATLRSGGNGRYGSLVTPPVIVATTTGTTTMPGSLLLAGTNARTDGEQGPGQPGAGIFGIARQAVDVTVRYTDDERRRLNDAGVIVIQMVNGRPRVYGNRTLADPATEPGNVVMHGSRVIMGLRHELGQILEQYVLRRVDADRRILGNLEDDLSGVCERWRQPPYEALYGRTPADAYSVDATSEDVNPEDELDAGRISARVAVRISPVGERLVLTITKVASNDQIAA
ncbi:MAG: hypothetical protein M0P31_13685 [Solirubrobacteraceae bacterium]|nr:hypothetical protein [Solirubrobacteraceae bacterium]